MLLHQIKLQWIYPCNNLNCHKAIHTSKRKLDRCEMVIIHYHFKQNGNLEKLCLLNSVKCFCKQETKSANEIHTGFLRQH